MKFLSIAALTALTAGIAGTAQAQSFTACDDLSSSCSTQQTSSASVPAVARIRVDPNSAGNFGTITAADFVKGSKSVVGPFVGVQANVAYLITVDGGFGAVVSAGVSYTKKSDELLISTSSPASPPSWAAGFAAKSGSLGTAATLLSKPTVLSGSPTAGDVTQTNYKMNLDWTKDQPGGYVATLTYTLTSP